MECADTLSAKANRDAAEEPTERMAGKTDESLICGTVTCLTLKYTGKKRPRLNAPLIPERSL